MHSRPHSHPTPFLAETCDIDAAAFRHGCALEGNEFFQCDLLNIEPKGIACSFQSGIGADSGCCEYICDKDGNYFFKGMNGTENDVYVDFSTHETFAKIGETYQHNIALWEEVFGIDGTHPFKVRRVIQNACYRACQPARPQAEIEAGIAKLARIRAEKRGLA